MITKDPSILSSSKVHQQMDTLYKYMFSWLNAQFYSMWYKKVKTLTNAQNESPNHMVRTHFLLYSTFFNFSLKLMFWFGGSLSGSPFCLSFLDLSKLSKAPIPPSAVILRSYFRSEKITHKQSKNVEMFYIDKHWNTHQNNKHTIQ